MEMFILRCCSYDGCNNPEEVIQKDPTLNKVGIAEAGLLDGYYDIVLISPLQRARDTLAYSGITYDKLMVIPEAREVMHNVQDLMISDTYPDNYTESYNETDERVTALFNTITNNYDPSLRMLLVSHCKVLCELTRKYSHQMRLLGFGRIFKVVLKDKK